MSNALIAIGLRVLRIHQSPETTFTVASIVVVPTTV
jgi:hypothetical protein